LRTLLFGLQLPCPETLRPKLQRTLILFAWATWLYRFFLFLGIALLVYHFFFKLLGIFLMIVELAWFIFLPIYRELFAWIRHSPQMTLNRNSISLLLALLLGIALLVVPWQQSLQAPALARYAKQTSLFPAEAGRLELLSLAENLAVERGEPLFRIHSASMELQLEQARRELEVNRRLFETQQLTTRTLASTPVTAQRLSESMSRLRGLEQQAAKLAVSADFDGTLVRLAPGLYNGQHVSSQTRLADLVATESIEVEAYFREDQVIRTRQAGGEAVFYPRAPEQPPMRLQLVDIENWDTRRLQQPALASIYGGDIPVTRDEDGALIPEQAIFRATFRPLQAAGQSLPRILAGTVHLDGERMSLLHRLWTHIVMVFRRESGF
jgi:putative peptide zinc metalloprotease protein